MTKITAIIPSLVEVDGEYLKLCVESLRESGFDGDINVVTNGSKNSQPLAQYDIKGITKHLHTRQQGQCHAVNVGAEVAESNTDYFFVINSDMYFSPGWDKNLRFDYPVFSPNLVEPTNNPGSAEPFIKYNGGFTLDEFNPESIDKFVNGHIHSIQDNKEESGFNLPFFIRADVWRTIRGYDTKFDPWGSNSDTDLQTKINLAGITPIRLKDVLVYHFSNKSGTFDGTHQEDWQKNWDYFDQKWGFNRDTLGSDVWYNKKMLPDDIDDIKYDPDWIMKYYEEDGR
jgi:GT2 family glycosyltransferase